MKRWFWLLALISLPVWGSTLDELVTALGNAGGVLIAVHDEPQLLGSEYPNLHKCKVTYYRAAGDVVTANTVEMLISHYLDGENEVAYWFREIPEPLRVTPVQKFITDRTGGGFTLAQVTASVQAIWAQANPATEAIKGLTVEAVDGATIRVRGSFDKGDGSNETRTYLMWLVDVNGSTTLGNANIKWRRETAG